MTNSRRELHAAQHSNIPSAATVGLLGINYQGNTSDWLRHSSTVGLPPSRAHSESGQCVLLVRVFVVTSEY